MEHPVQEHTLRNKPVGELIEIAVGFILTIGFTGWFLIHVFFL